MFIRNLRIAQRASLSFALITLLLLAVGFFSFVQMGALRDAEQEVETNWLPSIESSANIDLSLQALRVESLRLLAQSNGPEQDQTQGRISTLREQLIAESSHYRDDLVSSEAEARMADAAHRAMEAYLTGLQKLIELDSAERDADALDWANHGLRDLASSFQQQLNALRDMNRDGARASGIDAKATYGQSLTIVGSVMALAVALTVVLAWLLTRSLVTPINASVIAAEAIAAGDLTQPVEPTGKDEATRLMVALRTMQENLRDTLHAISDSSTQLASAAEEMSAVTEESSRGLQTQNGEVDQAATAVTEMSAAVDEVARNAVSASEAARQSTQAASVGKRRVDETLNAIRELNAQVDQTTTQIHGLSEQSRDISKVLSVINAIAEQTNLLALNAAIEAARAGEQGRGFAVVADEVRALAQRTQSSTSEIEHMILTIQKGTQEAAASMEQSRAKAEATSRAADQAGQALIEITESVNQIDERNSQIATASEEQAHVAREVDRNLVRIRDLSIQTAAGANQTSAASHELSNLAVQLNALVRRFKVT